MKIHNQSDKIIISFIYESSKVIKIECDINDKFEIKLDKDIIKIN